MTIPTYSTGTASIVNGGTTVTITGGILTGNARELDFIVFNGVLGGPILGIADATHLTVPKWTGANQVNVPYAIYQTAQRRSADISVTEDLRKQVAALNNLGYMVFVSAVALVPDPSLGDEGQYAFQPSTGAYWLKSGGLWVVSGNPQKGYGGTSTTSLALSVASKSFTTQAGLAYQIGSRVRLSNDSTHYMEGPVTAYNVTTGAMTVNVTRIVGTGTFTAWNLSITGDPSSGDLLASNNLSDLTNPATARANLAVVGAVKIQRFTSSGTYTPSAGLLYAVIETVGAGGGAGGTQGGSGYFAGSTGGAGGYSRSVKTAAQIGSSQPVTVGAAGLGGAAGANIGSSGGTTSVGSLVSSNGGNGGTFVTSSGITGPPGSGASAGTGDVAAAGATGFGGTSPTSANNILLTAGASSSYGGGGLTLFGVAGGNATGFGAGGGAGVANGSSNLAGGNGSPGLVIIIEYCSQ